MTTTADNKRDEAKEHLKQSLKCLKEVLDPDTWGHDQFKDSYMEDVEEVYMSILLSVKKL
jgi:hypothetical protein